MEVKGPETHRTDLGNARRMAAHFGRRLRHCMPWGTWLVWDERRWAIDEIGEALMWARNTISSIYLEAVKYEDLTKKSDLVKHALSSERESRLNAMVRLAESEPPFPIHPNDLDSDLELLNVLNGTLDLTTGELRPHNRRDFITKIAPVEYDPEACSPIWDRFLKTATGGNADLADFLQRALGYSITGDTSEEKLFLAIGPPATGKSSLAEGIKAVLGDYAKTSDFDTFLSKRDPGGPRHDLARLAGARFVVGVEVDEGRRLAQGLVKLITGGDAITARHLYKEAFEFRPQFKLWLMANHAPRVRDDDAAMWRRIVRIPFVNEIPKEKQDPEVKKALRDPVAVGPAILRWLVVGCLAWRKNGLGVPPIVEECTEAYRVEMDPLREFMLSSCVLGETLWVKSRDLREEYEKWARENGTKPLGGKAWAERLRARGCEPERRFAGRGWRGIGLMTEKIEKTSEDREAEFPFGANVA